MLFTAQRTVMPFTEPRKLNIGETGFYRVAYTPAMLDVLSEQCRAKALPPLDRWGVIHNAWVMAEAGMIDLAPVLDLCVSLRGETDYTVLSEVLSGLVRVGRFARGEKYEKQFAALVRSVCEPSVRRLSWQQKKGESHGDRLLRELVLLVSGMYGDEAVLVRALQEFKKIVRGGDMSVDINLRETVYRLTASVGGAPEWTYFKKRYQSEHSHEEQERLAAALASFTSPKLLAKTLLFAFSKDVRTQDFPIFCREVSLNAVAGSELWKFIKMHWSEILHRYGGNFLLSKTIASLSQLSSVPLEKEIAQFFQTKPRPGAERTLVQALEHIHTAALWRVRSQKQLPGYLGGK
jgi:puromycin-sensitive aminopeptidase